MTRLEAVCVSLSQVINAAVNKNPKEPFCSACYVNHWTTLERVIDAIYFWDKKTINGVERGHCYLSFLEHARRMKR
jgi:hypothetical protein